MLDVQDLLFVLGVPVPLTPRPANAAPPRLRSASPTYAMRSALDALCRARAERHYAMYIPGFSAEPTAAAAGAGAASTTPSAGPDLHAGGSAGGASGKRAFVDNVHKQVCPALHGLWLLHSLKHEYCTHTVYEYATCSFQESTFLLAQRQAMIAKRARKN